MVPAGWNLHHGHVKIRAIIIKACSKKPICRQRSHPDGVKEISNRTLMPDDLNEKLG